MDLEHAGCEPYPSSDHRVGVLFTCTQTKQAIYIPA